MKHEPVAVDPHKPRAERRHEGLLAEAGLDPGDQRGIDGGWFMIHRLSLIPLPW